MKYEPEVGGLFVTKTLDSVFDIIKIYEDKSMKVTKIEGIGSESPLPLPIERFEQILKQNPNEAWVYIPKKYALLYT